MKKAFKSLLMLAVSVIILFSSAVSAFCETTPGSSKSGKPELKFNSDGKFRIMMFNDTQDNDKILKDTKKLINAALDKFKPDLVILAGDNIAGFWIGVNESRVRKAIDNVVKPMDDRNIPFAVVFGNHDQESGIPKEKQMEMYMSYKNCLAVDEGDSLSNCGTYNILIKDSKADKNIFNIWMMDSGTEKEAGGYESLHADQIDWYEKTSSSLRESNGGVPLPSLLFQHIPVPEIYDLLKVVPEGTKDAIKGYRTNSKNYYVLNSDIAKGKLLEAPCSPDSSSGEFAAWVRQGDVLGAYFGHDHVNDLTGRLNGIELGYTPGAGFHHYGNGIYRGVRTFELDENNLKEYKTDVLYYKELVGPKAEVSIYDPYFNNVLRVAIPELLALIIAFLAVLWVIITAVRKLSSSRKMKNRTSAGYSGN